MGQKTSFPYGFTFYVLRSTTALSFSPNPWDDVRLVSFSVDPENDTPDVLKKYAERFQAGDRWYFLTGQRNRILRLVQEGFHLAVAAIPNDSAPSGTIPHSPRFVLVDKEARIRGYYDSQEPEAFVRLKNDIDSLTKG